MNAYIKASLDAFNVSKNCDRSSADAFYDSYIERKKVVIAGKVSALDRNLPVNRKKLSWELTCVKEVSANKSEVLLYIQKLIKNSGNFTTFDKRLVDEAREFIGDSDE
jgi:hypothetical protein